MRHLKAGRALGVKPAHRRAMLRNLVTSVIEEERIKTTVARAKELRKPLDHMITLGKQGDLSARRQALTFVKSKKAMSRLFGELAERFRDRPGGYSRILRLGPRRGDGAEMALVMLVGGEDDPFTKERKRKAPARKPKKVLDQVAEEVKSETAEKPKATRSKKAAAEAPAPEAPAAKAKPKGRAPEAEAEKAEAAKPAAAKAEAPEAEAAKPEGEAAPKKPRRSPKKED